MINTDSEEYMEGQLRALLTLANEVRLSCKRHKWFVEASAIQAMQDTCRASWREKSK